MILDLSSILSNNQAVTVTAASSNVYDTAGLGVGNPVLNTFGLANDSSFGEDLGGGGPLAEAPQLRVAVGSAAFTAAGGATLQIQLQAAVDTSNSGTPGTWQTIVQTDALPVTTFTAGQELAKFTVPARYPGQNFPRFYRVNYVVATGPMTAGNVFAALLTGIDSGAIYPGNF